jgi:hypothetical protein
MPDKERETDDLDAGWDDDEVEQPPATRAAESLELRALAQRAAASAIPPSTKPPRSIELPTMPPPLPASEYVATMMGQPEAGSDAPGTSEDALKFPRMPTLAERHRAILQTLHEEDPLRFDFDDAEIRDEPEEGGDSRHDVPEIETSIAGVEDLDPELLKDTPVPPRPPEDSHADELDELPVDEVLESVGMGMSGAISELRRVDHARGREQARPPPLGDDRGLAAISDLPLEEQPPPSGRVSGGARQAPEDHSRATLPPYDPDDPLDRVHDRFVLGDYSGALVLAESVIEEHPDNSEAQRYAGSCRDMLRQMYLSRIGTGRDVPRIVMAPDQLRWLTLDHRMGFLLSCVDGKSCIDEILDVSGMPGLDALRLLYELVQEGVIEVTAREQ